MKNFGLRAGLTLFGAACGGTAMLDAQDPTTTVGGVAYAGYFYHLKDTSNHVNNFDVTRAYINVIGKFAYGIGYRRHLRSTDGSLSYRLKYAYATWIPDSLRHEKGKDHARHAGTDLDTSSGQKPDVAVEEIRG